MRSRTLSELSRGRDNNLNLIRFLAASAVVYGHSFGISHRTWTEPFFAFFGTGIGDVGVNVFFFISGLLIAKSWFRHQNCIEFGWARVKRIYPALWSSSIIFVLLAAVFWTEMPMLDFLGSPGAVGYLLHNATMAPFFGAQLELPGAFPWWGGDFNTPLWTLPHELEMYALLAVLGVIGVLRNRGVVQVVVGFSAAVWLFSELHWIEIDNFARFRLMFFFFTGALFFEYRERIVLSGKWILVCAAVASSLWLFPQGMRQLVLALLLPAVVCWLAYVPGGFIRRYNTLGDFSYGLYIYAFPIQVLLYGEMRGYGFSPITHFLVSELAALLLAIPSWYFIEKRALALGVPKALSRLDDWLTNKGYCLARTGAVNIEPGSVPTVRIEPPGSVPTVRIEPPGRLRVKK